LTETLYGLDGTRTQVAIAQMQAFGVVVTEPGLEVRLQLVNGSIELAFQGDREEDLLYTCMLIYESLFPISDLVTTGMTFP